MDDNFTPTIIGVTSVDEWYDASADSCFITNTNNPFGKENNRELSSLSSEETFKTKTNNGINDNRSMQFSGKTGINVDLNLGPAPLCYEEKAIKAREYCDYSIKITLDMAKNGTSPRKIRIYADGKYNRTIF
jgi:hypothetical protein